MKMAPCVHREGYCSLVGAVGALLEETLHWGWAVRFQMLKFLSLKAQCHSLWLLPPVLDVEPSAPSPAPCLLRASHHDNYELNLRAVRSIQCNVFSFIKITGVLLPPHSSNTPAKTHVCPS